MGEGRIEDREAVIFRNAGNKREQCLAALFFSKAWYFLSLLSSSTAGPLMGLCPGLQSPGGEKRIWAVGPLGGGEEASAKLLCHCPPCCSHPDGAACTFGGRGLILGWGKGTLLSRCSFSPALPGFALLVVRRQETGGHFRLTEVGAEGLLQRREGGMVAAKGPRPLRVLPGGGGILPCICSPTLITFP